MSTYSVPSSDLSDVADAIRARSGEASRLSFPNGFVSAIQSIPNAGFYNPLLSLKCGILGDSVTEGTGASDSSKCYANLLAASFSDLENYGAGGSCISNHWQQPMVNRYNSMDNDLDVVILFGGINDFYAAAAIGNSDSTTTTDFNGALNTIFSGWSTKYAGKQIICVTPYQTDNGTLASYTANSAGKTMKDYVDAMKERCAYYSIPLLDLFSNSGIAAAINSAQKTAFLSSDGIHPNDVGHQRIYERLFSFLLSTTYFPASVSIPNASGVSF